jgi:hypothetical protein
MPSAQTRAIQAVVDLLRHDCDDSATWQDASRELVEAVQDCPDLTHDSAVKQIMDEYMRLAPGNIIMPEQKCASSFKALLEDMNAAGKHAADRSRSPNLDHEIQRMQSQGLPNDTANVLTDILSQVLPDRVWSCTYESAPDTANETMSTSQAAATQAAQVEDNSLKKEREEFERGRGLEEEASCERQLYFENLLQMIKAKIDPELLKHDVIVFQKTGNSTHPDLLLREGKFHPLDGGEGVLMTSNLEFWKMTCFHTLFNWYYEYKGTCKSVLFVNDGVITIQLME